MTTPVGPSRAGLVPMPYDLDDVVGQIVEPGSPLLAGALVAPREPRRYALVHGGGGAAGAVDHLFVDQAGVPTLVSVTPAGAGRSLGSYVLRLLEQVATSGRSHTGEVLRSAFASTARSQGREPAAVLASLAGADAEPVTFFASAAESLRQGRARLVVIADGCSDEAGALVELLNGQMVATEVYAVVLERIGSPTTGESTYVPRLVGRVGAAMGKESVAAARMTGDEAGAGTGAGAGAGTEARTEAGARAGAPAPRTVVPHPPAVVPEEVDEIDATDGDEGGAPVAPPREGSTTREVATHREAPPTKGVPGGRAGRSASAQVRPEVAARRARDAERLTDALVRWAESREVETRDDDEGLRAEDLARVLAAEAILEIDVTATEMPLGQRRALVSSLQSITPTRLDLTHPAVPAVDALRQWNVIESVLDELLYDED